jgi:hypothetical protein
MRMELSPTIVWMLKPLSCIEVLTKNEILRNKSSKEVNSSTVKTVRHDENNLKMTQINGKIFHVYGVEELILLKCPCYTK